MLALCYHESSGANRFSANALDALLMTPGDDGDCASIKQKALARTRPLDVRAGRYRAPTVSSPSCRASLTLDDLDSKPAPS